MSRTMWRSAGPAPWFRVATLLSVVTVTLSCGDDRASSELTAPATSRSVAAAGGDVVTQARSDDAAADGNAGIAVIPLPVNQTFAGAGTAFRIANSVNAVSSHAGEFALTGGSGANALRVTSNGTNYALRTVNTGTGAAGLFSSGVNATASFPTVQIQALGANPAIYANSQNSAGVAAQFLHRSNSLAGGVSISQSSGAGSSMRIDQFGTGFGFHLVMNNTASTSDGITVANNGTGNGAHVSQNGSTGRAAYFHISTTGNGSSALLSQTFGGGWAGEFLGSSANSRGVLITTQGGAGLQVVGGSKNAVVGTSSGARALYTEESSEVWFTEYGTSVATGKRTHVSFDHTFAETVNLTETYHVFLQPYGDAEFYVANRTPRGFDVVLRDGSPNVEFSYRIVAKRKGFERKRLERAPWADTTVRKQAW